MSSKEQLNTISQLYLKQEKTAHGELEMEAKFGTRGIKPLTKLDYENVVKKIKSNGWSTENASGVYLLRIQTEFIDPKSGKIKVGSGDRFRIEVVGLNNIQEYCKTNQLDRENVNVSINRKIPVRAPTTGEESSAPPLVADFNDFNFRVSLNKEEVVNKTSKLGSDVFDNWNKTKKVFRYINRVTFTHPDHPFQIDLSIVKSSSKHERGWMIQTYSIEQSGVFENPESYEMEIEAKHTEVKLRYKTPSELSSGLQKVVTQVLSGLQRTNYPISYTEQTAVLQSYQKMIFGEDSIKKRLYPSDFIGPSLVTLDMINIGPLNPDIIAPNIREPYAYCVTEKADGERHLLYVNDKGRIYLINTNMNVLFTGAKTENEQYFNSLLDGELILHDHSGHFINKFAVFDLYYVKNIDVRALPFMNTHRGVKEEEKYFKKGCRLPLMKEFVKRLTPTSLSSSSSSGVVTKSPIHIVAKQFYPIFEEGGEPTSIFEANNFLLRRIADHEFEYEIDGLIFTPTLLGVGSSKVLEAGPKKKVTWPYLFKWKPSEKTAIFPKSYNTIDFLVVTKKGTDGRDLVTPLFESGMNNYEATQFNQYKSLFLTVGFNQAKHGYINPCQELLEEKTGSSDGDGSTYQPKQFVPSDPYDASAGMCNVMLEMDSLGTYQMFTEDRQVFGDQMVVEFRYDMTKPGLWKWIPMRVRFDKTADFRNGNGVGANDYNTANNNWHSIHNPITEEMIATGKNIPGIEVADDVYYNSITTTSATQGMRNFHNLYVKKVLIQGVSKKGNTLIDFACGKAGDLPKWIAAELSFVFGIDLSSDNIGNRINGACARYLNFRKVTKKMPYALFVNGNSALNIRSGTNMLNDKANQITKAVFGNVGVDRSLGPAVERQHGKGHAGFDVSSCQFAIHYMCENKHTFYQFLRNVSECTKLAGYFIATCYDGRTVFNLLKNKQEGESVEIYADSNHKIWSITKQYDYTEMENNESCLGYKIDVFQDSINQSISEFLVNADFLIDAMEKYGFALVTQEESRLMRLPSGGSGMFADLFVEMEQEVRKHPEKRNDYQEALSMTENEKEISFLNRYFVFKKVSARNAEKLTKTLIEQLPGEEEAAAAATEQVGTMLAREAVAEAEEELLVPTKKKVKKLSRKLVLREEEEEEEPPLKKK